MYYVSLAAACAAAFDSEPESPPPFRILVTVLQDPVFASVIIDTIFL